MYWECVHRSPICVAGSRIQMATQRSCLRAHNISPCCPICGPALPRVVIFKVTLQVARDAARSKLTDVQQELTSEASALTEAKAQVEALQAQLQAKAEEAAAATKKRDEVMADIEAFTSRFSKKP